MTLRDLWDVLAALERGEARAECACGAMTCPGSFRVEAMTQGYQAA